MLSVASCFHPAAEVVVLDVLKQCAGCAQVFSFTAPLARSAAEPKAAPARSAVPTPWYDPAAAHEFLTAHGLAVRAVGTPQTRLRLA